MPDRTLTAHQPNWPRLAQRAVQEGIEVRKVDGYQWIATSGSDPHKAYLVSPTGRDGALICSCPAGQFGSACKHAAALMLHLGTLRLADGGGGDE